MTQKQKKRKEMNKIIIITLALIPYDVPRRTKQGNKINDDNLSSEVGGCQFVKANLITMSSKASYGLYYDGVTDQHFRIKFEQD